MNPGTVLPIYELSKPAPSTAWVFLHRFKMLNYITIFSEKEKLYFAVSFKAVSLVGFIDGDCRFD